MLIFQPVVENFFPCSETPSYALTSFAAEEKTGSAVSAGHRPQALVGIVWVSQKRELFLVNHMPQLLRHQGLRAYLLLEFLWEWTEDAI